MLGLVLTVGNRHFQESSPEQQGLNYKGVSVPRPLQRGGGATSLRDAPAQHFWLESLSFLQETARLEGEEDFNYLLVGKIKTRTGFQPHEEQICPKTAYPNNLNG